MTQAKVWKMREYWMYFPFFILHDWGKRFAEARSSHYTVLPKDNTIILGTAGLGNTIPAVFLRLGRGMTENGENVQFCERKLYKMTRTSFGETQQKTLVSR